MTDLLEAANPNPNPNPNCRKLINYDDLLEAAHSRLKTRKGFRSLWFMMFYTGVMVAATMTAQGDRNLTFGTERGLLDTYVTNATAPWSDIKVNQYFSSEHFFSFL